jgi:hypothetical protein
MNRSVNIGTQANSESDEQAYVAIPSDVEEQNVNSGYQSTQQSGTHIQSVLQHLVPDRQATLDRQLVRASQG